MAREDGFLSRWSRLKQEAAKPVPPQPSGAELDAAREAEAARAADAAAREAAARAAEEREREEIVARLPRIEDLAPDSDFRPFMHPLVPQALRSAALARLWLLDPGISGYVDPALDYAHNWHVPGGIPGGGPPPSAEEVQSTLRQIFARFDSEERVDQPALPAGAPDAPAAEVAEAPAKEGDGPGKAAQADPGAAQPPLAAPDPGGEAGTPVVPVLAQASAAAPGQAPAEAPPPPHDEEPARPPTRRHGGAMPA
ncbi:MAG: DUF3306 domain-containing protein [Alphaproteobacteria bacterium]